MDSYCRNPTSRFQNSNWFGSPWTPTVGTLHPLWKFGMIRETLDPCSSFQNSDWFGSPWIPQSPFKNSDRFGDPRVPTSHFKNSDQFSGPYIPASPYKNFDRYDGSWILGPWLSNWKNTWKKVLTIILNKISKSSGFHWGAREWLIISLLIDMTHLNFIIPHQS